MKASELRIPGFQIDAKSNLSIKPGLSSSQVKRILKGNDWRAEKLVQALNDLEELEVYFIEKSPQLFELDDSIAPLSMEEAEELISEPYRYHFMDKSEKDIIDSWSGLIVKPSSLGYLAASVIAARRERSLEHYRFQKLMRQSEQGHRKHERLMKMAGYERDLDGNLVPVDPELRRVYVELQQIKDAEARRKKHPLDLYRFK